MAALGRCVICILGNYVLKKWLRRDAREAEGARLEIVYSANNGIEGSTPSLSAIKIAEQFLPFTLND